MDNDDDHGGLDEEGNGVDGGQDDTGGYVAFCYWLESLFAAAATMLTFRSRHWLHIDFGTQAF